MVAGGVDEDSVLVPAGTLQPHVLIHRAHALQLAVADVQSCTKPTHWSGSHKTQLISTFKYL